MRGGRRRGRGEASDEFEGEANESILWRNVGPTAHARREGKSTLRSRGVRWLITRVTRLVSRSTGTLYNYQLTRHAPARVVSRQFAHRTTHYGVVSGTHNPRR
jgi:hypothetical protein